MLFQMNMATSQQWHRRTIISGEDLYKDWWKVKASASGMFPKSQITTGWLNFKLHRMTIMATSSLLHNVPFNRGKRNRVLWIQTEHYNSPPRPSDLSGRYRACKWTNSSQTHMCAQTNRWAIYSPSTTAGQTSDRSAHCKYPSSFFVSPPAVPPTLPWETNKQSETYVKRLFPRFPFHQIQNRLFLLKINGTLTVIMCTKSAQSN